MTDQNLKMESVSDFTIFRQNLRSLISSKGILGKELAYEVNATPATISRYINGQRIPDLTYICRIAQYFGVSVDWLLGLNESKQDIYTPEINKVTELYAKASREDQLVVRTVLRKYDTDE